MVMLGVDPGIVVAGYSIVTVHNGKVLLLDCGFAKMSSSQSIPERLSFLYDFFKNKIDEWKVTHLTFETPFLGKNAQNFLKLGYVRGILYLLSHQYSLPVNEYSPSEIKRALTGAGSAEKQMVARVILRLFPGFIPPDKLDVTDAVAVSLCGVWSQSVLGRR